jgi:hypothetical protein
LSIPSSNQAFSLFLPTTPNAFQAHFRRNIATIGKRAGVCETATPRNFTNYVYVNGTLSAPLAKIGPKGAFFALLWEKTGRNGQMLQI